MQIGIVLEFVKIIAKNIDKNYKWIARDRDGSLYAYEEKPKKAKIAEMWYVFCPYCGAEMDGG